MQRCLSIQSTLHLPSTSSCSTFPGFSIIKIRKFCSESQKQGGPNLTLISENYAQRTEIAAANYRNTEPALHLILPPPNVTGKLHLGHALTVAIEDTICRHHRIKGRIAHWLPGFDHAGIATQAVAERELWKERGQTRNELSREEFVQYCQRLSSRNSAAITEQLKRLGATLNWSRQYYTLNEDFSAAVNRAFCELHAKNLIYRGERVVNWCPILASTLSDQEVERVEVQPDNELLIPTPSKGGSMKRSVRVGQMHRIRYKLKDSNDCLEVGTTRPETCFADVAVAVHPSDSRYSQFIGKLLEHPLVDGVFIPIIADEAVLQGKGTGAVKITPAHDALDFEIASRHWEEIEKFVPNARKLDCLTENGQINTNIPKFKGLDRFEAREEVLAYLQSKNAYQGVMKHSGAQVNICTRTGDIIEPRVMKQWFMDTSMTDLEIADEIRQGKIKINPAFHSTALISWLTDTKPWCLSRQLLWGHRIPAFTVDGESWYVGSDAKAAANHFKTDEHSLRQDDDVLDTWFSSSLIPLVSAGWMDSAKPFDISHTRPINIMETGWDILGFWVARMLSITKILSNGYLPFDNIILHGLIRDASGRKMSKSLGNVIDPNDIIDGIGQDKMITRIEESQLDTNEKEKAISSIKSNYSQGIPARGVDALRFTLLKYDPLQIDIRMDVVRFAQTGFKFIVKLWNLAVYYEKVCEFSPTMKDVDSEEVMDRWLVSRMASTLLEVDKHMAVYETHHAFQALIEFVKVQLSDTYIEATKIALRSDDVSRIAQIRSTLQRVLQPTLVQLSVFLPFVSEYIYERIFHREAGSIYFDFVKAPMLTHLIEEDLEESMSFALDVLAALNLIRGRFAMKNDTPFEGILQSDSAPDGFTELYPVLRDWGRLCLSSEILKSTDSTAHLPANLFPYTISGGKGILYLKIEDSVRADYEALLASKLADYQGSVRHHEGDVQRFEQIIRNFEESGKSTREMEKRRRYAAKRLEGSRIKLAEHEKLIQEYGKKAENPVN